MNDPFRVSRFQQHVVWRFTMPRELREMTLKWQKRLMEEAKVNKASGVKELMKYQVIETFYEASDDIVKEKKK